MRVRMQTFTCAANVPCANTLEVPVMHTAKLNALVNRLGWARRGSQSGYVFFCLEHKPPKI